MNNISLNIFFSGYGTICFYYGYNSKSTFYDLLEALAFCSPFGLKICPHCQIQIKYRDLGNYYRVNMNDPIQNHVYPNCYLQVILNIQCKCIYQNYPKEL